MIPRWCLTLYTYTYRYSTTLEHVKTYPIACIAARSTAVVMCIFTLDTQGRSGLEEMSLSIWMNPNPA